MAKRGLGIQFSDIGIATALDQFDLKVPLNQRSYAWEDPHVRTLFEDFSLAISSDNQTYFLGTIVLTHGQDDKLEVADGQQRLATTSILIAAIRDYLYQNGGNEKQAAEKFMQQYLLNYDEMSGEHVPKITLNFEDNDFFLKNILLPPGHQNRRNDEPKIRSNYLLKEAFRIAQEHVQKVIAQFSKTDKARRLYEWIRFLREHAVVIMIRVPDDTNAYTMFETLNDRGLKASQADILKNFLFAKSQDRLSEVQPRWSSMVRIIDAIGDEDLLMSYLRHHWIAQYGPIIQRELAAKVKEKIQGRQQAVDAVIALDEQAIDYAALLTPLEHGGWPDFDQQTRAYIYVVTRILGIEQIRPLLLAVVRSFHPSEAKWALRMFVSWSVRFLIAGGGGGGVLDRHYGLRAKEVTEGSVTTTAQLNTKMTGVIRSDADFQLAFRNHRVSKNNLARYYLRALELYEQNDPVPELGGILEDTLVFNLEHIMPQSPSDAWDVTEETAQAFGRRLGNMVLLNPNVNVKIGNKPFTERKPIYASSPLVLTQEVADYEEWGPIQIDQRQTRLADLAPKIWAL
jgi:hypothetical protein